MDDGRRYFSAAPRLESDRARRRDGTQGRPATGRSALTAAGSKGERHATSGAASDRGGDDAELLVPDGPASPGRRPGYGSSGPGPGRVGLGHERREPAEPGVRE